MNFQEAISYKEYITGKPIVEILKDMALNTREYNGTIESFLREFAQPIDYRPELIEQYGLFDTMVRDFDRKLIGNLANRFRLIDPTDTVAIDRADELMNTLTHAFDMHLVTCPQCGIIHSFLPDSEEDEHTCSCGEVFTSNEAPDLFMQPPHYEEER